MNITSETQRMLGQPSSAQWDEMIKALSTPDDSVLSKSLNPAFAGRLNADSSSFSPMSAAVMAELEKAGLSQFGQSLTKSITQATGLVAFDLQAPAKNLYPFYTPIRNSLPRVGGGTGTATNWRQVNAIIGSGQTNMGWVPEGQRSGRMSYNTSNRSASYVTFGEEDSVTYEAINAARQFEDIQATMAFRLMQQTMLKEEMGILGGNASVVLAVPAAPTVSAATLASSTLPSATYYVQVVALTIEGWANASRAGVLAVSPLVNITGADGSSYQLAGGNSNISALSSGQATTVSTTALAAKRESFSPREL
jgi:hypothetical protein